MCAVPGRVLVTAVVLAGVVTAAPLSSNNALVADSIDIALQSMGITTQDCGFRKSWDPDPYRMSRSMRYLHDPFAMLADGDALYAAVARRDVTGTVALLETDDQPAPMPAGAGLVDQLMDLRTRLRAVYETLSPEEVTQIVTLTTLQFGDVARERSRLPAALAVGASEAQLLTRLAAVDEWLYCAEDDDLQLLEELHRLPVAQLRALAWQLYQLIPQISSADFAGSDCTALGILIGSPTNDVYSATDAWCIIDPGGDDSYENLVGHANRLYGRELSVIIDYSGNDRYSGPVIGGPGSAILGVSVICDHAGDDIYDSGILGTAAAVGGAGIVIDKHGNDRYRAARFSQGFGFFGLGALIDGAGNDVYEIAAHGQAYGGVQGHGYIFDLDGQDVYIAGRDMPDTGRYGTRFVSLAQGVGMGMRPCASGGIGCLADSAGNDYYIADVFGQGVGYWYGIGLLVDACGEDAYQLYEYGQGAGIHMAAGMLVEGTGNDIYTLRGGIGQGAAHDFATGVLRDKNGNDQYQGHITVQGTAINNGVAILLDETGDDWYSSWSEWSQGYGAWAERRDFGSLGFCIDSAGNDYYHDRNRNGYVDVRGWQGVCVDRPDEDAGSPESGDSNLSGN
jgi:hypothetical protein